MNLKNIFEDSVYVIGLPVCFWMGRGLHLQLRHEKLEQGRQKCGYGSRIVVRRVVFGKSRWQNTASMKRTTVPTAVIVALPGFRGVI